MLGVDEDGELIDPQRKVQSSRKESQSFEAMVLENLRLAGVQQTHKSDKLKFESLEAWPGYMVCASGRYVDGEGVARKAAVMVGPEFGTVSRADLVEASKEAAEAGFDVLVSCAFSYEAHAADFQKMGKLQVLKARMSAELHMADDLKNTGKGNLFVVFGEPDFELIKLDGGMFKVKIRGVDVFDPMVGEVRSDDADGIACWFLDTNYNGENFFVRHAYFLGANDPYQALKTTLKAEVNEEAWETLRSDTSREFERPKTGRIAIKVINHLGDEVMKVVKVS
jgi:adenine-specific DNA-methyltransferase